MLTPLLTGWIAASVPKTGSKKAENEDATAGDPRRGRFALADGATEGWQSGGWARHLVGAFVHTPPVPTNFPAWLSATRRGWSPPAADNTAAWYAAVKQEQGSFATLVGLEFRAMKGAVGLAWKAVAVGDSCLLVFRRGGFALTFPLTSPDEFGSRPPLVPSSPELACPEPQWLAGYTEPGDLFVLASDAVARYLMALAPPVTEEPLVLAVLEAVASGKSAPVVESLLSLRDVLNDDASILAVLVPATPESHR